MADCEVINVDGESGNLLFDLDEGRLVEGFSQAEVFESGIAQRVDQLESPEGVEAVLDAAGDH